MNKLNYQNIVNLFLSDVKVKDIAKIEKCSEASVRNILKKQGIYKTINVKWTKEQRQIVLDFYSDKGGEYCAEVTGINLKSILSFANGKKLHLSNSMKKVNMKKRMDKKRIHKINKELFYTITHPEEAYILGLLWADGCFRNGKNGDNSIRLVLKERDASDVRGIIMHSGNWADKTWIHNQNKTNVTKFRCCDKELYNFLLKFGYADKSTVSASKIINHIPENLRHYWWRGYFDGDGFISICSKYVTITGDSKQDWSFLKLLPENIDQKVKVGEFFNKKSDKINKYSKFSLYGEKARVFLDYIYQGSEFGIKRKLERYKKPVKTLYKKGKRLPNKIQLEMNGKPPSF